MAVLSAQMKWHATSPFAELQGIFPFATSLDFNERLYNLSSNFAPMASRSFDDFPS